MSKRDFLFELGTEELPPKSLSTLARALAEGIEKGLGTAAITHGEVEWFATPRRLAVRVHAMADKQPDQEIKRQGPAIANAFDAEGQPTKAAAGFAASCGVTLDQLQQVDGPKGRVLMFVGTKKGEPTAALLPGIVKASLDALPMAKAHVVADASERRERIRREAVALAQANGGHAVIEDALLDEVTALVEWPVPLAGRFEERYLQLPHEVPIATMQDHQRYFPVR